MKILFGWLFFTIFCCYADDIPGTPLFIHGIIYDPPPCTINGDQDMDINFGKVASRKVDGKQYKKVTKNIELVCHDSDPDKVVSIKFQSNINQNNKLQTNIDNFSIALYRNDDLSDPLPMNQFFPLDRQKLLRFTAIPTINDASKPTVAGSFTTSMVIVLAYL